jgi:hypothetical protein
LQRRFQTVLLQVQSQLCHEKRPRFPIIEGVEELIRQAKRLLDRENYNVIG